GDLEGKIKPLESTLDAILRPCVAVQIAEQRSGRILANKSVHDPQCRIVQIDFPLLPFTFGIDPLKNHNIPVNVVSFHDASFKWTATRFPEKRQQVAEWLVRNLPQEHPPLSRRDVHLAGRLLWLFKPAK